MISDPDLRIHAGVHNIGISSSPAFYLPLIDPFPSGLYISRCFDIIEHRCRLATVRLISLQAHPGGIMRRERSPTMENRGGRERGCRVPRPRIIPEHFSWDSEACALFAPSVPHGTRRLRPLSREKGRCSIYSVINSTAASSFSPARARASSQLSYVNGIYPSFLPSSNESR